MATSQAPRLVMCSSRCSDASNFVLSQVVSGGSGAITITYHVKPSSKNAAAFAANIDKALRQAGSVLTHASTGTSSRGNVGLLTSLQQPVPLAPCSEGGGGNGDGWGRARRHACAGRSLHRRRMNVRMHLQHRQRIAICSVSSAVRRARLERVEHVGREGLRVIV
eukprot:6307663-Prymnesium_polylepis.1